MKGIEKIVISQYAPKSVDLAWYNPQVRELFVFVDGNWCPVGKGGNNTWGFIGGDITEQEDLVNYVNEKVSQIIIPESNKEVVSILSYDGEPASASEGDYYINSSENKLYKYISGAWVEQAPSVDCLYVAIDSSKIYAYINSAFTEVTGQDIDGVIAVNEDALDSTLAQYKEDGVYTVISMYIGSNVSKTLYTLSVVKEYSSYNDRYTTTQVLRNEEYIYTRTYNWTSETWNAWRTQTYAFRGTYGNDYLAKFDNEGKLVSAGVKASSLQGKLNAQTGIYIDGSNKIYQLDAYREETDVNTSKTFKVDGFASVIAITPNFSNSSQTITIQADNSQSMYYNRDVYVAISGSEYAYSLVLQNGILVDGVNNNYSIGADKWVIIHYIRFNKLKPYHNMPLPNQWVVESVHITQGQ